MATKSFTSEFTFKSKSAHKLLNAIENSTRVDHSINQRVETVSDKEHLDNIIKSSVKEK